MLYYLQKHGENLETDPASYGCLHPKWQKQHKDKLLSKEDWSALWQVELCSMEPINPKSSHHMTSLDKWTVSAVSCCSTVMQSSKCMLLQAWCVQNCQGDLSDDPEKHEAFMTWLFEEALASPVLTDPARYYQNSASSIYTKLLKRHGYAKPEYNPLKSLQHRQRGKVLRQLHRDRAGR